MNTPKKTGKTLTYVLPAIIHAIYQDIADERCPAIALILAASFEEVEAIKKEVKKFCELMAVNVRP